MHKSLIWIPAQNGEPWIAGDATPTPPDIEATIPIMVLSPASAATELPTVVDNSVLIFMPPATARLHPVVYRSTKK